jgi:aspartyl-tRNA(Asn)/glutamyl-tRNA(Gln) amidotransferase subunit A
MDDGPLTITAAAGLIRAGKLSPVELLDVCLRRIDRYEPRLKAWVYLDRDRARSDAEKLTAELAAGQNRGPLHGIPIGVKDIIDVFDMPTGCGSKLWANSYARRDATVVERLRQAGAVILGKTVTTPFAYLDPPPTRNPWNLDRTPGGSSSGSAAAVACGMCLGALGTQTGGSITRPASYCGVCSLKPTHGRVSADGVLPLAPSLDHVGVMANCVRDLAIQFQAIAGPDSRDASVERDAVPDAGLAIDRLLQSELQPYLQVFIGSLGGMFRDRSDTVMWETANKALARFMDGIEENVNHEKSVPPAEFADVPASHLCIMSVEAAHYHAARIARHPEDYPPRITELIRSGLEYSAVSYRNALDLMCPLCDEVDASLAYYPYSAFLTPATTAPAPTPETTGNPAMNSPWSYLGLPTVSLPTSHHMPGEPPLAIQLAGTRKGESRLLAIAARFEATNPEFQRKMPPVP